MDHLEGSGELIDNIDQRAELWTTRHLVKAFCFEDGLNILDFEQCVCAAHGSGGFTSEDFDVSEGQRQMRVAGQVQNY